MNIESNSESSINNYDRLKEYAEARTADLSSMLEEYVDVTDDYGRLICRLTSVLGTIPPKNEVETTIRDLFADVFDNLYETRPLLLKGKSEVAFPLARRAYESLSLLVACHFDSNLAKKWNAGKEIGNAEIRKILNKHPMGETEESTKELYKFFSKGSHPNRDLIAERYLGDGNFFVLGSIGVPDLILTADLCNRILSLWFWYVAFVCFIYMDIHTEKDIEFRQNYLVTANKAKSVSMEIAENFNRLLEEFRNELKTNVSSSETPASSYSPLKYD